MSNLIAYAQMPPASCNKHYNTISVEMATNRNDMKYVSYASGILYKKKKTIPVISYFLEGDANQQFSDRSYDIGTTPPGGIHVPIMQNFSVKNEDLLGLNIKPNGDFTYTLKSWGNAKSTVSGACINNILYGVKDGTFYTLSFKKTKLGYTGPC
ncbi:hypothetical protein EDC35_104204 [Thiobaca trueperi]|uniref:Uncharacterized protein n=2 Tax=Thiobaca trueperi TaxID=127458 RepID=A0A4R3N3T1_9GAMM|nr:hypothetical protein EDC35_104204 [Thiobaca trueperi]